MAELFGRVYPEHRWRSPAQCQAYFREILFHNPWRDLALPSWVAEEDGRITGFYGVMPRRMQLHGQPLRVAVGCQFMIAPDKRHSLTAFRLAKACLSGSQDLTLADGASDETRRAWSTIGGKAPLICSLHWTRPLRPFRYVLSQLEARAALARPLALAARPLARLGDALADRLPPNRFHRQEPGLIDEALDPATMAAQLPTVMRGYALQPDYDAGALAWLLEHAARKMRHGMLRARSVGDGERRLLGWYLYYLRQGGVCEVLQLVALHGSFDRMLRQLLADAWRHGATALRGRLEPRYAQELSAQHCWMRTDSTWTLIHSRRPEIIAAIHQGEAFLSRLEGEWWLRFIGE